MISVPDTIVNAIRSTWLSRKKDWAGISPDFPGPPTQAEIREIISVSYAASMLTEELRPVVFRLILGETEQIEKAFPTRDTSINPPTAVPFSSPIPLTPSTIRRLAPAADPNRVLIAVRNAERRGKTPRLEVWGLVDVGTSWWEFNRYEASMAYGLPRLLTVGALQACVLSIGVGDYMLARIRHGKVHLAIPNILYEAGPLLERFATPASEFRAVVTNQIGIRGVKSLEKYGIPPIDHYVRTWERILLAVLDLRHGGTVLIVPDDISAEDERLRDRISVKHQVVYSTLWSLLVERVEAEYRASAYHEKTFRMKQVKAREVLNAHLDVNRRADAIESRLKEAIRFVANLSAVDGAVVITDRFRVIGFGAEIVASSAVDTVYEASAATISGGSVRPVVDFGTRHRSAVRFCSSFDSAVAFVVSQDGGLRAFKRCGGRVVLWSDFALGYPDRTT